MQTTSPLSSDYQFATGTGSSPASGKLQFSDSNVSLAQHIYINDTDQHNTTAFWAWAGKAVQNGLVRVINSTDATKWYVGKVIGMSHSGSVTTLNVIAVDYSSTAPFASNDGITISMDVVRPQGGVWQTDHRVTVSTFGAPGSGYITFDQAIQNSTYMFIYNIDRNGNSYGALSLLDGSGPVGYIRLVHAYDPSKFLLCRISAINEFTTYTKVSYSVIEASNGNVPFANDDPVTVVFDMAGILTVNGGLLITSTKTSDFT